MSTIDFAKRAARRILGRSIPWDVEPSVRALHRDAVRLTDPAALPALLNDLAWRRGEPDFDVAVGRPGTAVSYIPYVAAGMGFVVHNYFAHNYGIRDTILYRAVLLDGPRAVATRQFCLAPNETLAIRDAAAFLGNDASTATGILMLSAHHPRIATPAGQLRYFGLYASARGLAGCHSMAASATELPRGATGYRAIAPESDIAAGRARLATLGPGFLNLAETARVPAAGPGDLPAFATARAAAPFYGIDGYLTVADEHGAIAALWHDGAFSHRLAGGMRGPGTARTALGLPQFDRHAPLVLIDAEQIGQACEAVEITLVGSDGREHARRRIDGLPTPRCMIDLAAIFADVRPEIADCAAVFDFGFDARPRPAPAELMVHAFYRDGRGTQDQTHTIRTLARSVEASPAGVRSRARKFGPLVIDRNHRTAFSIYNLATYGNLPESEYVLRFFTDRDGEILARVTLPANGAAVFWADAFFPNDGADRTGVVWIEHPDVNAAAHWFVFDNSRGGPATDHFTGG